MSPIDGGLPICAVFWVNVPVGIYGTVWAYLRLRDNGERHRARIDWWGNITFAVGLSAVLIAVTYSIQPYGGHAMGWTNPWVLAGLIGGVALLGVFVLVESRIPEPMFQLSLFRIRAFTAGNLAGLAVSIARGGLQFVLIIWLQGIWLPLHGYDYSDTPLWAGIFLLPLTAGFLVSGPVAGFLSDRFGSRGIATAGLAVFGASFIGLMLLPVDFPFPAFALLIAANGIGSGMFAAPNSSSIMQTVRKSQAGTCTAWCGTAAGHAVAARGGFRDAGPVNREPTARPQVAAGIPVIQGGGGCQNGVVSEPEARIRPINEGDRPMLAWLVAELWGSELVAVHGTVLRPAELPGFIAERSRRVVGLLTYQLVGEMLEIVTLNAIERRVGIGTLLIEAAADAARHFRCHEVRLTTTNDNVDALRFYQRRGFRLAELRPGAVDRSRQEKPQIPRVGDYGIPLHDEIDLTLRV